MSTQAFNCEAKHTKYQPTDEEFNCPKCGAKVGDFFKDDPVGHDECELLHDEDNLCCATCGYGCSGKAFAARIVKAKNLVSCPCCKGKGFVKVGAETLTDRLQKKVAEYRCAAEREKSNGRLDCAASLLQAANTLEYLLKSSEVL